MMMILTWEESKIFLNKDDDDDEMRIRFSLII